MKIYGKDPLFIRGVKEVVGQMVKQHSTYASALLLRIYVMSGMDITEIFSCLQRNPPEDYAIFIAAERDFDLLKRLYPDRLTLCVAESATLSELRQALAVMETLRRQNLCLSETPGGVKFTRAERQIMQLTLRGYSIDDIARARRVSPVTISVQRSGLMRRTGTRSLLALCALYRAYEAGQPAAPGERCSGSL
ncbi:helix-turn-helix transcriptional regulator [Intestinirhabdus alba]|jgi:DNA-binding NarL/FixJ family response regulator|uniref:Helix-turn-helix transcriptional regulator n=1 Tax=Intestinirhabdus alba TaxID=2899544 RepID=A0A6L6IL34_9ENTR|nr:LuxR C-terminal-related transcriptional regulator [Intestinirhabdus alba]MTH46607.1 helix-turn-helix transcriptional regulator [Intestinirhabdus alba]